jgi:hypothetical protein
VWADDGEEHLDTVALGWTAGTCTCADAGPRYQFTVVWLNAADVKRR